MLELRKMNYEDVVEQWKYVTELPTDENGLTNQYEGVKTLRILRFLKFGVDF